MPYYGVNVTGPAVTVIPPDCSVVIGVEPNVKLYVLSDNTLITKPLTFSYKL
jgi:hypothetical protein